MELSLLTGTMDSNDPLLGGGGFLFSVHASVGVHVIVGLLTLLPLPLSVSLSLSHQ
jgi:hypothetical protein